MVEDARPLLSLENTVAALKQLIEEENRLKYEARCRIVSRLPSPVPLPRSHKTLGRDEPRAQSCLHFARAGSSNEAGADVMRQHFKELTRRLTPNMSHRKICLFVDTFVAG